jgi:pyruvate kinase
VIALRSLLGELAQAKQGAEAAPRGGKSLAAGDGLEPLPIISKIEKPQAVADIDAIVDASDGIMVARGDLGVEMDLAEVPVVQKQIIEHCHAHGKPVIVATQMLETMIEAPTPTRAEVSDIANAILDGSDAVMLSGETSVGKWPLRAAETMSRVAQQTNDYLKQKPLVFGSPHEARGAWRQFAMIAEGAWLMASGLDAKLVVLWGELERAAYLSRRKASRPILLFAEDERQLRRSALLFGVTAVQLETPASSEAFLVAADQLIQERGWAKRGDTVLVMIPTSLSATGAGNTLMVHRLGDPVGEAT